MNFELNLVRGVIPVPPVFSIKKFKRFSLAKKQKLMQTINILFFVPPFEVYLCCRQLYEYNTRGAVTFSQVADISAH